MTDPISVLLIIGAAVVGPQLKSGGVSAMRYGTALITLYLLVLLMAAYIGFVTFTRALEKQSVTLHEVLRDCLDPQKMKPPHPFIDAVNCGSKWDKAAGTVNIYRSAVIEHFGVSLENLP